MRIFSIALLTIFLAFSAAAPALANDPEGIIPYCEKRMNKYNDQNDCACIAQKYYPKKAELEQQMGVPIMDKNAVLQYLTNTCHKVENSGDYEYKTCLQSPSFRRGKEEFGAERFCKCYAQEWKKELSAYQDQPNSYMDSKIGSHLKTNARATCKRKLR